MAALSNFAFGLDPQGLKPHSFQTTYAALKRRSSTVALAFTILSQRLKPRRRVLVKTPVANIREVAGDCCRSRHHRTH